MDSALSSWKFAEAGANMFSDILSALKWPRGCQNYFSWHQYGVAFSGDTHVYRPEEVEIPLDLVLVPDAEVSDAENIDERSGA